MIFMIFMMVMMVMLKNTYSVFSFMPTLVSFSASESTWDHDWWSGIMIDDQESWLMIENHDWWSKIMIDNWVSGFNENKNTLLSIVRMKTTKLPHIVEIAASVTSGVGIKSVKSAWIERADLPCLNDQVDSWNVSLSKIASFNWSLIILTHGNLSLNHIWQDANFELIIVDLNAFSFNVNHEQ